MTRNFGALPQDGGYTMRLVNWPNRERRTGWWASYCFKLWRRYQ